MYVPHALYEIDFVQHAEDDDAWEAYDKIHEFYLLESSYQFSLLADPGTSNTIQHVRNDVEIVAQHMTKAFVQLQIIGIVRFYMACLASI